MCCIRKKVKNMPFFLGVLPISAPRILKKTGLTIQAYELKALVDLSLCLVSCILHVPTIRMSY